MSGTTISTVGTVGISLTSAASNPVTVQEPGGISVTSGLYALAGDSTGFFVPAAFTIISVGAVIEDIAPNSFGVTLNGGGVIQNHDAGTGFPGFQYFQATISGNGFGVAISGGFGTVTNNGTIQATATSGVGVVLDAGGTVFNAPFIGFNHGPVYEGVIRAAASFAA